ncbi:c-type cytochrome [Haloflavibacter putidus]|uniref:Cytochrome c n=1 Tax=Haloflavibacter putidus TaxID=2576776 RepID=A0A508A1A8_9FLAO|nr:cytochrome c [Haloflavibacter putidus]TQD39612.1 cytochrome c [Haloflavibacter putidus]
MKSLFKITLVLVIALSLSSCFDEDHRNYEYFPNMYEPIGYETYGAYDIFLNEQEAKLPVEGSIPRGWMPYSYEDNLDGYDKAKAELKNPLPYTEENVNEGQALFTLYCAICHGDKGNGKGTLVEREKILGVPSFDDAGRAITEGSVYHVMYYGLNTMGSYAAQTSEKERWQIDHHVMDLKAELEGGSKREFLTEEEADQFRNNNARYKRVFGNAFGNSIEQNFDKEKTVTKNDTTTK